MIGNLEKYSLIYSPRTTKSNYLEIEENLFNDLVIGFDPYSIQILKRHFKEQLGELTKETFISILKRHLLTWHPNIKNREKILIKLLSRLFDEIDLNSNGNMEWDEFTNYIIHSSIKENVGNSLYKLKFYNLSKQTINHNIYSNKFNILNIKAGINEIVSYCFYIEKLNIIGLIHDENHKILFFDGNSCEKKNYEIDLIDILDDIDKIEFNNIQKRVDKNNLKINNKENYKILKNKNIKKLLRLPTPTSLKIEIDKINNKNINFNLKNNKNSKVSILCCEYLNCYDILLISSTNNKISAWKFYHDEFFNINSMDNFKIEKEFKIPIFSTEFPQLNMCFDHKSKLFYSGQYDGKIFEWELTNPKPINILNINSLNILNKSLTNFNNESKIKSFSSDSLLEPNEINNDSIDIINLKNKKRNIKNFQYNRNTVSCLLLIEKNNLLASAYYNGAIILWDTILKVPKKIYNDQKTGIYQMCYDNTKNLLFSCGFEHSIFIYDPYNEEHAIYKLDGHNWSINSISLNPYENELISMDILGNIKIWDINNYYNYQTINLNDSLLYELNHLKKSGGEINKKKISSNLYLLSLPKLKKILVYGDKFLLYEKKKSKNPNACDDNFVLGCVYNSRTNDLITISTKSLKMWSIYIGKVRKLHDNLMDVNDITAFCFDNEMKRVYLGDNTGKIKCFNLSNGAYLKDFSAHKKEIQKLIHSSKYNMLISLCNEQVVKFHDDIELLETNLIKDLFINNNNEQNVIVKDVFLHEKYNLLIMGLSNGNVSYYDISHFRYENEIKREKNKKIISISSICNIDDLDVVFISYENGKKKFTVNPRNKYYKFIFTENFGDFEDDIKNNNIINNNNKINDVILCTFYNKNNHYLYCGDDTGNLNCFDLNSLYQTLKNQNLSKENFLTNIKKIQIKTIYKISANKESINYINYPQEISPEIIITTGTDHYVKLFDIKNGEFIDSLKQISFKISSIPIAIKYYKNNPFLKNNLSQNNIEIIYRSDIENQSIKIPQNEIDNTTQKGVYIYSNLIMDYNAKIKLLSLTNGIHLKKNRSTNWNFDVNIEELDKLKDFNMKDIIEEVDKKQIEIEKTEKNFKEISIFNPNYKPLFVKNLDENSKSEFNVLVNNKIRNIKFAITKSQITINESKMIEQIEKKTNKLHNININYHKKNKSYSNKKNINLKKINYKNIKNLPFITMSLNETKFKQFKNDFDKRIDELKLPFKLLINRKNKKKIPKLSLNEY